MHRVKLIRKLEIKYIETHIQTLSLLSTEDMEKKSVQGHLPILMHCVDRSWRKSGGTQEFSFALKSFAAMRDARIGKVASIFKPGERRKL